MENVENPNMFQDAFQEKLKFLQEELKTWLKIRQDTSIPGKPQGKSTP